MKIPVTELEQRPCYDGIGLVCVLCYRLGRDEWSGTVDATTEVVPPGGMEEFVCDEHAKHALYDTETKRLEAIDERGNSS